MGMAHGVMNEGHRHGSTDKGLGTWIHVGVSVGEVWSQTDWDPVWTRPNPTVPVPVWDFPKNTGPLGPRSGHSHIAQDCLRPGLDRDRITYISYMLIFLF